MGGATVLPIKLIPLIKINTNQLSISPQRSYSTPATANQITYWSFMTFSSFVTHGNKQEVTEVVTPVEKSFSFRKNTWWLILFSMAMHINELYRIINNTCSVVKTRKSCYIFHIFVTPNSLSFHMQ